jgi:competence protein ComEC
MILGEKKNVPQRIEKNMIRTGTIHILVVSGFNVGLIALIFSSLLKLLRVKKTLRFYFIVPLVIFYCLLTGASTPVLRATLMAVIFLAAIFLKREQNLQNSLFLSMFLILIINPAQLYDLGFQLSFVSVASIFYLYPKINHLVKRVSLNNRPLQLLVASLEVSLSAWLGTFPLIAYYFRLFSPITVIANILIVPLATLVIFSGISFLCIKLTLPFLSPWFKISTEAFILALLKVNQFMAELPGAYFYLK